MAFMPTTTPASQAAHPAKDELGSVSDSGDAPDNEFSEADLVASNSGLDSDEVTEAES